MCVAKVALPEPSNAVNTNMALVYGTNMEVNLGKGVFTGTSI